MAANGSCNEADTICSSSDRRLAGLQSVRFLRSFAELRYENRKAGELNALGFLLKIFTGAHLIVFWL